MPPTIPAPPARRRTLERSIEISCAPERLFRFHRDTRNIPKVQPGVEFLSIDGEFPLEDGHVVSIRFRPRYFPRVLSWRFVVEAVVPETTIIDVTLSSPFPYWRHEHRVERIGEMRSLLIDRVEYVPPLGLLGRLFGGIGDRRLLRMLDERQAITKTLMERSRS